MGAVGILAGNRNDPAPPVLLLVLGATLIVVGVLGLIHRRLVLGRLILPPIVGLVIGVILIAFGLGRI